MIDDFKCESRGYMIDYVNKDNRKKYPFKLCVKSFTEKNSFLKGQAKPISSSVVGLYPENWEAVNLFEE